MQSSTKIRLTLGEISAICRAAFGRPASAAVELTDGWFNTIYRIDVADSDPVVLKLAPAADHPVMRYERHLMKTEVDLLRRLEAADVPVPHVLAHDATGEVHAHEYFLMSVVPGTVYSGVRQSLSPAVATAIDRQLGALSARINALTGPQFGRYHADGCTGGKWSAALGAMVEDVLLDATDSGARLPLSNAAIRRAYLLAAEVLDTVTTPQLVIWDLHPGNVFVQDGNVSGIIDCDRALWGDPLMEFAFRTMAGSSPAFQEGYASAAGMRATAGQQRRVWLYDLYLVLVMLVECAFRGYEAAHRQRVRGEFERVVDAAEQGWLD